MSRLGPSKSKRVLHWLGASVLAAAGCASPVGDAPREGAAELGQSAQPIIKGAASSEDQNAVILIGIKYQGAMVPNCSGTMVAPNLVLTARHCVGDVSDKGDVTQFKADELFVFTGADAPQKIARGAAPAATGARLFTPPGTFLLPDIALILLDKAVQTPIAPIRLTGGAVRGEALTIVGFGLNEKNELPSSRRKRDGVSVLEIGPAKTTQFDIEEGEFIFGEAACSGDSGGPALSSKTKAVVGVASRVSNGKDRSEQDPSAFCVGSGTEDVYTDLSQVGTVLRAAFAAAGAEPVLESTDAAPSSTGGGKNGGANGGASSEDGETTTLPPPPPQGTSGCAAAASADGARDFGVIGVAVALVALGRRRKRA